MYEVTLETLSCGETADPSEDNCRLEVYIDDNQRREPYSLREPMVADGPEWAIHRTFAYERSVRVELHVEDWLFPDDWVEPGTTVDLEAGAELGSTPLSGTGSNSVSFQREGADYELTYSVNEQPSRQLKQVDEALDKFGTSGAGEWMWVDAGPLKSRVEDIVNFALGQTNPGDTGPTISNSPFQVNQDSTPFCGPAGIAFSMASREPRRFVETVRSLYEQGEFLGSDFVGHASDALRYSSVPSEVRSNDLWADWVLLGGIRESAHWFNVANNMFINTEVGSIVHMNLPWTMAFWSGEVLGHTNSKWLSCSDFLEAVYAVLPMTENGPVTPTDGAQGVLQEAKRVHDNGGFATLLVDGRFPRRISSARANTPFKPFHWVALGGRATIGTSDVTVEYHDSRDDHLGRHSDTFPRPEFEKHLWGAVAGGS